MREAGLEHEIEIDSAGTGGWHAGDPPDRRATEAARGARRHARGRRAPGHARATSRTSTCCWRWTARTSRELRAFAPDGDGAGKARLLREFDPASAGAPDLDVPDPYYGGPHGFETVLDQVEAACRGLLDELR